MAKYFSKFPKIYYNLKNANSFDITTNIIARFALEEKFKNNTSAYYNYVIRDGETPEIIAAKLYGSAERHWVVLLMNDIIDAQYDWPLNQKSFYEYVEKKYANKTDPPSSGIVWAKTNTHSYYKKETVKYSINSQENIIEISPEMYEEVDVGTKQVSLPNDVAVTIITEVFEKSYYDYENEINENKRNIKILKNEFVFALENELELVANE